ncbi:MAG: YybS family protein [Clostridiaceae bacterium]|nr:YybS family protein [Clostridiaceae bacterium]
MGKIQTKALVEGAIFASVTAILGILYYYMQYLGVIAMVWPVPVIIVGYRNGLKASILSALSAGLIVSLLTQPLVGVGLLVGFGLPGVLMGYMINKRVNPYLVVFLCGLVLSITMVGELLLSLKAAGIDTFQFLAGIDDAFKQQLDMAVNIYKKFGIAEKDLQSMSDYFTQTIEMMKLILPSALVISGLMFSFIDYKLTRLILKRIGQSIPNIEEFSKWRLTEPYSFILLGLAVFAGAVSYLQIPGLNTAALNISTVLMFIFSIIGVSIIAYYARVYGDRNGIPKALRRIIVVLIVLVFMQFIALAGILDLVFNFRKLEPENRTGGIK